MVKKPIFVVVIFAIIATKVSSQEVYCTWCDPTLGCLVVTEEWDFPTRPINVCPDERESINTQFMIHTREEPSIDQDIFISADNLTTISSSTFNSSRPTKFICHGFLENGFVQWMRDLAQYMLMYDDYNVIRVDWGGGSKPMYAQAVANTRVVGLEIGHLVNTLIDVYGVDPLDVHVTGHSLGSHISGYAGDEIENLGRITGLDPAGPYFTATDTFVALDADDAVYVDVIHTDADSIFMLGWGTGEPMGNVDFYPNSGHDQPGCNPVSIAIDLITVEDLQDIYEVGVDVFACSHVRAIEYFEETLFGNECKWTAHECYNYDTFIAGHCQSCDDDNSKCAYMGIRADEYVEPERKNVLMYHDTTDETLFCLEHYGISISLAYPNDAEAYVIGKLLITLYGTNGNIISDQQITEDDERLDHGQVWTSLFTSEIYLDEIMWLELEWHYDDQLLDFCGALCNKNLYVDSVEVSPINHYPESERLNKTLLACSRDGSTTEIENGGSGEFYDMEFCHPIP